MQVMRQLNRSQAFRLRKSDYERNEIVTACIRSNCVVNADYLLHICVCICWHAVLSSDGSICASSVTGMKIHPYERTWHASDHRREPARFDQLSQLE